MNDVLCYFLMSYALMLTVFLSNKFMFARKILYRSRNIPFLPTVLSYTHCPMGYKKTASINDFNQTSIQSQLNCKLLKSFKHVTVQWEVLGSFQENSHN